MWLDNFVVGDDIGAALKLAEETWRPKYNAFEAIVAEEKKKRGLEKAKEKKERCDIEITHIRVVFVFLYSGGLRLCVRRRAKLQEGVEENISRKGMRLTGGSVGSPFFLCCLCSVPFGCSFGPVFVDCPARSHRQRRWCFQSCGRKKPPPSLFFFLGSAQGVACRVVEAARRKNGPGHLKDCASLSRVTVRCDNITAFPSPSSASFRLLPLLFSSPLHSLLPPPLTHIAAPAPLCFVSTSFQRTILRPRKLFTAARTGREATVPSKMLTASRFLADKTRPYLPAAAVPALDSAAENPVAVVATVLVRGVGMWRQSKLQCARVFWLVVWSVHGKRSGLKTIGFGVLQRNRTSCAMPAGGVRNI